MEHQEELFDLSKALVGNDKITFEKDSLQYNAQDLDQEQNVDVNPVQLNTQNFHVHVNENLDFSGKITGITLMEINREILPNVWIQLFFGHESRHPILRTNSDQNGNFIFEELPPGYYTLRAEHGSKLRYWSSAIKVLPCQKVNHTVLLQD